MAKSNNTNQYRKKNISQVKPPQVSDKVSLRLLYNVKYVWESSTSGRVVWPGAGSVASVSKEDAPTLLSKIKYGCNCGSPRRRDHIFEEA
jgi:hypothetical protein